MKKLFALSALLLMLLSFTACHDSSDNPKPQYDQNDSYIDCGAGGVYCGDFNPSGNSNTGG